MEQEETNYNEDWHEEEALYEHYRYVIDPGQDRLRIDKFLVNKVPNATRSKIQQAIQCNNIKVNDQPVKSNYKIRPEDVITISLPYPPPDDEVLPENIPLDIIYEDDALLIVNKPAGMVVHPGYNNKTGTMVNALVYHFQNLPEGADEYRRPGLVHRIDKNTTGLMVIAKTDYAMAYLANQFYEKTVERTYYGLIWGEPEEDEGTIEGHIARSRKDRKVMSVYPAGDVGKHAVTHFKVLKRLRYVSLVECKLETGRTHQIRVHMQYAGHPLFADEAYGGYKVVKGPQFNKFKKFVENAFGLMPRQALHAKSLGIYHPSTGEFMQFDSELPEDFRLVLDKWEHYLQYN